MKIIKSVVLDTDVVDLIESMQTKNNDSFSKIVNNSLKKYLNIIRYKPLKLSFDEYIKSYKTKDNIVNDFITDYKCDNEKPISNDYVVLHQYFYDKCCEEAYNVFKELYKKYINYIEYV